MYKSHCTVGIHLLGPYYLVSIYYEPGNVLITKEIAWGQQKGMISSLMGKKKMSGV